jgi:transposase
MANLLKMAMIETIVRLHQQGWSNRRIAKELGIDRDAVSRHVRQARGAPADSKAAKAPPGSEPVWATGTRSLCQPWRSVILAKVEAGLTAQRIYQDLVSDHDFEGKYHSVRRFVRLLGPGQPLPFRRLECAPGEEAQVDFGSGIPITGSDGRRRHTHVFRIVLSHSRKGYSEVVHRQTTDDFLSCLENAFKCFGDMMTGFRKRSEIRWRSWSGA